MKKILGLILVLMLFVTVAFASNEGESLPIGFALIGSARGGVAQASTIIAIPTGYSIVKLSCTTGVGTVNTLAKGRKGQILTIVSSAQTGSDTIVITPTLTYGFTTATIGVATTSVTLLYVDDTFGWIVIGNNGATVA